MCYKVSIVVKLVKHSRTDLRTVLNSIHCVLLLVHQSPFYVLGILHRLTPVAININTIYSTFMCFVLAWVSKETILTTVSSRTAISKVQIVVLHLYAIMRKLIGKPATKPPTKNTKYTKHQNYNKTNSNQSNIQPMGTRYA